MRKRDTTSERLALKRSRTGYQLEAPRVRYTPRIRRSLALGGVRLHAGGGGIGGGRGEAAMARRSAKILSIAESSRVVRREKRESPRDTLFSWRGRGFIRRERVAKGRRLMEGGHDRSKFERI